MPVTGRSVIVSGIATALPVSAYPVMVIEPLLVT